jgi:PAS domain S-box-containing protein
MSLSLISLFLQWHWAYTWAFIALAWLLNFSNFLTYSFEIENYNHIIGNLIYGFIMDYHADYPLFSIAVILGFVSAAGRNHFPFWINSNNYLHLEIYFWFASLLVYILSIYLNSWQWIYSIYIFPLFISSTVYTWLVRVFNEAKGYKNITKYGVEPGDKAIDFELPDQNGNMVRLKDFEGKTDVLVLFVRGDWCPACHIMLRTYYKYRDKFKEKGIFFIAIGPDPMGVNKEMLERLQVDFTILSDEKLHVTRKYGVRAEGQVGMSNSDGIPLPAAFIVDKKGIIRYNTRPESPGSFLRPDSILSVLDGLKSQTQNETFEATYETIVSQANDGILVLDIVEGRILNVNHFFANLLQYSIEEIKSKTIFDLYPNEFLEESARLIADAWEKKGAIYRMQFKSRSDEIIPTECSAKVLPYGNHSALVLYVRDIRERLRMENQIIEQSKIIEKKNKDILASIEYAKRIQTATLPDIKEWYQFTKQTFIYFQPRDIVSGDFYWLNFDEDGNRVFFALGDCTGHGVPGAFMSMLAINQLNHIIDDLNFKDPVHIITQLDQNIQKALKQEGGGNDGLDCALFSWDKKNRELKFVLAGRPLFYSLNDTEVVEVKPDKYPIGGTLHAAKQFTPHTRNLQPSDSLKLILYSDGIVDQIGGDKKRKFGTKKLRSYFEVDKIKNFAALFNELKADIESWKNGYEQLDDMSLLMIEL